ncbi:MAG: DUF1629 domain-containing protein [Rhizobiaceae bacterium]
MTYYVYKASSRPAFQLGDLVGWDEKVPLLKRRADISGLFKNGKSLLDPAEMPDTLRLSKTVAEKCPAAFISQDGICVVNSLIHDLLEEMDRGIHQFIPIKVIDKKGKSPNHVQYILNVHHMLDTIIDEKSYVEGGSGARDGSIMHVRMESKPSLTVDTSHLSSVNLWTEQRYPTTRLMSDKLFRELKARNLKFFQPIKIAEL